MTIRYHDVSHHNTGFKPSGPTAAKATEGQSFVDSAFRANRVATLAGGWSFIAYHYLHRGNVAAQVAHAIAVVGKGQPLMLDVEVVYDANGVAVPSQTPRLQDVYDFADTYARQSGGGRVTLGYIPHWFHISYLGSVSLAGLKGRGIALIASKFDVPYSDVGAGWNPYGGVAPSIWQYTNKPLDTNAFRGTQDQLAQLFAHGTMEVDDVGTVDDISDAALQKIAGAVAGFEVGKSGLTWAQMEQRELNTLAGLSTSLPAAVAAALDGKGFTAEQLSEVTTAVQNTLAAGVHVTVSAGDTPQAS